MSSPTLADIVDSYDTQAAQLQSLQTRRVRDILLVASLYDSYTLSEGKHLTELIFGAYHNLSLTATPRIKRVSTRRRGLELLAEHRFDMVITMSQVADMPADVFGQHAKEVQEGIPVFLLAYTMEELRAQEGGPTAIPGIDRSFIWRGDVRLFLTIIKLLEDQLNADHDTRAAGVRAIILVEDSVPFYSSYLPMLLSELVKQTSSLIDEEVNLGQRMLRRRLRPKILLATCYEEAWALYERYCENVLCVISDVEFPRAGQPDPGAGIGLMHQIRNHDIRTPLLLQSSRGAVAGIVHEIDAGFVRKHSPTILNDLRAFMLENLGFGDFVFRTPDGVEVARASDVNGMLSAIATVPVEALHHHGTRHDFSNWLMARTEFAMATEFRNLQVSDFDTLEDMREFLTDRLSVIQAEKRRGQVADFRPQRFSTATEFVRIGSGSLGGKGRGLAFMHELLSRGNLDAQFENVRIDVPHSAVVGTDSFDRFLEENDLLPFALRSDDDRAILRHFIDAPLPEELMADLATYLSHVQHPIAVRSSSLLEDSQLLPAAGIYPTHMLPNQGSNLMERLDDLACAIKHVYASTFFRGAKTYLASTANLVEDEKMAVVLQQLVGRRHGDVVYPDMAGTAASYNFYPVRDMMPEDGVANVALGLGKTVVEGGRSVRFCPAHPEWLPQFASPEDMLDNAQREFQALDLTLPVDFLEPEPDVNIVNLSLGVAERDGTLWPVASTYSPDNQAIYDGISRPGARVVTMAPVLKHNVFPLAAIVQTLLDLGSLGMSVPVEIEYAVDLRPADGGTPRFALLQLRPLGRRGMGSAVSLSGFESEDVFVRSAHTMGAGRDASLRDVVSVRMETFERAHTQAIADDIGSLNSKLSAEKRRYLLIGPGRWGTSDRWLGVPVSWAQISGVGGIVECGMEQLDVEPSQGTHFFHNLTSFGIPYFHVGRHVTGHVDWEWMSGCTVVERTDNVVHYRLEAPLEMLVDGRTGDGVVLKPRSGDASEDGATTS